MITTTACRRKQPYTITSYLTISQICIIAMHQMSNPSVNVFQCVNFYATAYLDRDFIHRTNEKMSYAPELPISNRCTFSFHRNSEVLRAKGQTYEGLLTTASPSRTISTRSNSERIEEEVHSSSMTPVLPTILKINSPSFCYAEQHTS